MSTCPAALQFGSRGAVALQAEGAHVGEVALAAAFDHRQDVIGVPEVAAMAPLLFKLPPGVEIELALVFTEALGVQAAGRADTAVPGKDLLPQIAGIGAELPFVHAGRAAEGETAARDLAAAAPARASLALHPPAGLDAARAHTRSS